MPTVSAHVPKYCFHRARGLAYVRIRGRVRYLGKHGSPESKQAYLRILAELEAAATPAVVQNPERSHDLTVIELCAAYLDFAEGYYVKDGRPTEHVPHVHRAIRVASALYGETPAVEFGPLALRAVQAHLVKAPSIDLQAEKPSRYCRATVNDTCQTIKRMFKWAASNELVPVIVYQALTTVPGLKRGRTEARESKRIGPVADEVVEQTLPHLSEVVADMVRFQRLTGCRPGEVCQLRPIDLDRGGKVWRYRPASHKTEHHDRERVIFVGPKVQAILLPYLLRPADACCFSPAEAVDKRYVQLRVCRKTPVQPSQRNRRKPRPKRIPSTHYSRDSYRRAIARGIAQANRKLQQEAAQAGTEPQLLPDWHPNQLRHSAATEIRERFGLEAAQVILGHSKADVTQVYAERDYALAASVAEKIG